MDPIIANMYKDFEKDGEAETRRKLISNAHFSEEKADAAEAWLKEKEIQDSNVSDLEDKASAREANALARNSNALACEANSLARKANALASQANALALKASRTAKQALIIAIIATIAAIIIPLLIK